MNTLVSIIVPVFNREDLVGETIQSVLSQTYTNWELILVDDGSTDDTVRTMKRYAACDGRILVTSRPPGRMKGANACRNHGLSLAKGDFIKWIDSDDILLSHALMYQMDMMAKNPDLQAFFAQSIFFNSETKERMEPWSRKIFSDNILWDYVRNNIRWHTGGVMWRKSFFDKPPFLEVLRNSQEWLMHGEHLLQLTPELYAISDDVIYLVRRGNQRMSSFRNGVYYYNQAKARMMFLKSYIRSATDLKIVAELIKQINIYFFHSLRCRILNR